LKATRGDSLSNAAGTSKGHVSFTKTDLRFSTAYDDLNNLYPAFIQSADTQSPYVDSVFGVVDASTLGL